MPAAPLVSKAIIPPSTSVGQQRGRRGEAAGLRSKSRSLNPAPVVKTPWNPKALAELVRGIVDQSPERPPTSKPGLPKGRYC